MEPSIFNDETKENVQPLRKGRRADHFGTVLQAQTNNEAQMELDQQRQQYELAIRVYEGDDPLEPRYEFAQWIEQSYPTLGPECKLIELLEDTINLYKDDDRYKQDPRFVEMLIKCINAQMNPLELYQLVYNQGLGTMCAWLYLAWAEELEKNEDWKRADQVYELGIRGHAEPLDVLKSKHEQYQLSVGRHMLIGDIGKPNSPERESVVQRQALTKLHKRSITGVRVAKGNPGILRPQPSLFAGNNQRNSAIKIFQEENESVIASGSVKSQMNRFPKTTVANKENSLKPGPWTNKSTNSASSASSFLVGRNSVVRVARTFPSTPSFQVHEDETEGEEICSLPNQMPIVPRVLKPIRSESSSCQPTIFFNTDPNIKVMYPKHKVYVGGGEFQLEELKAAHYFKKNRLNCSQGISEYGFETPMVFRQNRRVEETDCTPTLKTASVRLFADGTPNNTSEQQS